MEDGKTDKVLRVVKGWKAGETGWSGVEWLSPWVRLFYRLRAREWSGGKRGGWSARVMARLRDNEVVRGSGWGKAGHKGFAEHE